MADDDSKNDDNTGGKGDKGDPGGKDNREGKPKRKRSGNRKKGMSRAESLRRRVEKGTANFRSGEKKKLPESPGDPSSLYHHWKPHLDHLAARNYSPRTIQRREQALRRFLWWARERGLDRAAEVTLPVLETYQAWLSRHRKPDGKTMAVNTQRGELLIVQNFFRWLVRQRVLPANPASELELPRPEKHLPPEALSVRQVEAVMGVPDTADPLGIRDRAMLEVLYSTGLRRAELAALLLEDINTERMTLFVRKGKGFKDRIVPLGSRALLWIERYLERTRPRLVIRPGVRELFLTGLGEGFPPKGLGQHVSALLRRADVAKGGPHILRHTCATHMLEGGADQRFIQQLLGHEKADTTALYAQVSITHLQQVHARCHPAERPRPPREDDAGEGGEGGEGGDGGEGGEGGDGGDGGDGGEKQPGNDPPDDPPADAAG